MIYKHSRKIAISFVIVLGLSLAMILFDLSRMKIMHSKIDVITKEHNVKTNLMLVMRDGIYERQVSLRNIMLLKDPFDRDEGRTEFNSYALDIITARDKFASMPLNEEEKKVLEEMNKTMVVAYDAQVGLIEESIYKNKKEITKQELLYTFKTQEAFFGKVEEMINIQKNATQKAFLDAEKSYEEAKTSVYILGGSSIMFGLLVAFFIIRITESQARDVNAAMLEIERANEKLEENVLKRTRQLAQARDEALASNKAKDTFLATMSHELRTPLNIILGYSELLEDIALDEGNKKLVPDLHKIKSAAQHQLGLINSILDISKIEDGKLEINPVEFDVEKLIDEINSAAKPLVSKNGNEFNVQCTHGIGMMFSDNIRIRQILLNLISNAAKFTENGTITFHISKNSEADEVIFSIEDTGVGIDQDYMGDLFKKFSQADSSTTRKYGGSGLGLSISMQLANQLGGIIKVNSEVGKGSMFSLVLPVKCSEK